ncbi:hypothetical protein [Streptomyces spiralis]
MRERQLTASGVHSFMGYDSYRPYRRDAHEYDSHQNHAYRHGPFAH